MAGFEHYMYVAECADGTLYTGYAVDPVARVAKHNTGKGAKYTRSRLPVSLLAQARYCTKHQAMSAEAHFKKLDRDRKDVLLARAAREPFEDVLASAIPALAQEPVSEFIARELAAQTDAGYKDFMVPLMPSVDPDRVAGVRTPALKKLAKAIAKRPDCKDFLKAVPHALFEEDQLHAFIAGGVKDYDQALAAIEAFLPFVDNWATCDQLPTKVLAKDPARTLERVRAWIASDHVYTARFGMGVLMHHFLDDLFEPEFLALVANKHTPGYENPEPASDAYYLDMMRAWFFAEAMAKQPEAALPALERRDANVVLDEWTRKKAIQKSVESFRVTPELKARLKAARKL